MVDVGGGWVVVVVGMVMLVVGSEMMVLVGNVLGSDVDDDEVVVELLELDDEDELDDELAVDDDLVVEVLLEVVPAPVCVPAAAVTRLLRSAMVTSGRLTPLVPGIVLDSSGAVEDGKISVRDSLPELNT